MEDECQPHLELNNPRIPQFFLFEFVLSPELGYIIDLQVQKSLAAFKSVKVIPMAGLMSSSHSGVQDEPQKGALYNFCGVVNTISALGLVWTADSASDWASQIAKGGALLTPLWHSIVTSDLDPVPIRWGMLRE